jgi:hypothetical protein
VGEMFWARVPWGGGRRGEGEGGRGGRGGGGGARGEGGGGRGARACVRACVRACTRRLTCPLLPNVNVQLLGQTEGAGPRLPSQQPTNQLTDRGPRSVVDHQVWPDALHVRDGMLGPLSPNTGADRELWGNGRGLRRRGPATRSPRGQAHPVRIRSIAQQRPETGRHAREDNVRTPASRRELRPPGFV